MTEIRPSSRCACGKWWSNLELFQDHVCDISVHATCGRCSHQIGQHRFAGGSIPPTHRVCAIAGCECREFVDAYGDPVDSPAYVADSPDYVAQILRSHGYEPVEQDARRRRMLMSRAVGLANDLRAEGRFTQATVVSRCANEIREMADEQARWVHEVAPMVQSEYVTNYMRSIAEWLIAEERHKGELAAAYWRDDVLPAVRRDIEHHKAAAGRCRRMLTRYLTVGIQRRMRMDAALTTIQQVRDAVKGMRSTLGKGDPPHIAYGFFLDRLDRITSGGDSHV